MPWDANIPTTQFKGKLPLQSINQWRGALDERFNGKNWTMPEIINSNLAKFNLIPKATQSYMWNLVNSSTASFNSNGYINHLDHDGDWDGFSNIPYWTQFTMRDTLGLPFPVADYESLVNSKLFYFFYSALNLCRWAGSYGMFPPPPYQQYIMFTNATKFTELIDLYVYNLYGVARKIKVLENHQLIPGAYYYFDFGPYLPTGNNMYYLVEKFTGPNGFGFRDWS